MQAPGAALGAMGGFRHGLEWTACIMPHKIALIDSLVAEEHYVDGRPKQMMPAARLE